MELTPFEIQEPNLVTPETDQLHSQLATFITHTSLEYRERMHCLMDSYGRFFDTDIFTPNIRQKMIEHGHDFPIFNLMKPDDANAFLVENEIIPRPYHIEEDSLLLVFNLPSPIARFWYKGNYVEPTGGKSNSPKKIKSSDEIQWGYFYRNSIRVIREAVKSEEEKGDLNFFRLNETRHHLPNCYYAWEVFARTKNRILH